MPEIQNVTFYKRDEITTDLLCCDIVVGDRVLSFHEEMTSWDVVLARLGELPGFRTEWFSQVSQPPFAESSFVAFNR